MSTPIIDVACLCSLITKVRFKKYNKTFKLKMAKVNGKLSSFIKHFVINCWVNDWCHKRGCTKKLL